MQDRRLARLRMGNRSLGLLPLQPTPDRLVVAWLISFLIPPKNSEEPFSLDFTQSLPFNFNG